MLAFSIERYLSTKLNVITLEIPNMGYIYVGAKAYNSGVILSNKREYKDVNTLEKLVKPINKDIRESIKDLYSKLPYPLKPLAYMLYLTEIEYVDFVDQIGALNIILQFSHPVHWFATPKDQRQDFDFGSSIRQEYELDWKEFFDNSILLDNIMHPKENTDKFPIFVINANLMSDISALNTQQPLADSAIVNADGTVNVNIEFDDDDVVELPQVTEDITEDIVTKDDKIPDEYKDLLGG